MAKTMMHQEPCKIKSAEDHNTRKKELDYIFPELTKNNESHHFDSRSLKDIFKECKAIYEDKIGQKMQEKTAPIREAIFVIDENTTMDDMKMLADEIGVFLQWKPLQIHIHRDEGYPRSANNKGGYEVAKLNLHAHVIFDVQNKLTGKMNNAKKSKLSVCQDITARVLRMERGQPSTKKHLDSIAYKIQAKEQQIIALENQIKILETQNIFLNKQNNDFRNSLKLKQEELIKTQKSLSEMQNKEDFAMKEIEQMQKKIDYWQKQWEHRAKAQGELEYMAERFVQAYKNNPRYINSSPQDMFDELTKNINNELKQGRGRKL